METINKYVRAVAVGTTGGSVIGSSIANNIYGFIGGALFGIVVLMIEKK